MGELKGAEQRVPSNSRRVRKKKREITISYSRSSIEKLFGLVDPTLPNNACPAQELTAITIDELPRTLPTYLVSPPDGVERLIGLPPGQDVTRAVREAFPHLWQPIRRRCRIAWFHQ